MEEREANTLDGKAEAGQSAAMRKPLRLWPGVLIAVVLVLVRYGLPLIAPDAEVFSFPLVIVAMLGGLVGGLAILVWWLFFSRAPWPERVGVIVLMIVALLLTRLIVHESIAGAHMGVSLYLFGIPGLCLALVVWATATHRLSDGIRRVALVAAFLLACVPWVLIRTAGVIGADSEYHWRWTPTPEERLLAQANDEPKPLPPTTPAAMPATPQASLPVKTDATPAASPVASPLASATVKPESAAKATTEAPALWPGFRGPRRDGVVRGVQIKTDWSAAPPVELWRRPIGPGWSSFAVRGDLLYTQEQRGEDEMVACYKVSRASRCGGIATRCGSGSPMPAPGRARRRPSAAIASTPLAPPAF
jgi:outer membrane protein assembly factor BamB